MTIRSEAQVTEVHTYITPDGERQDRSSYHLDYQTAVEQATQIGPHTFGIEILVFDNDHVTLPASQCPNDHWTRERRILSIVQQISLLDTATRELLATTRCVTTIDGSTSGTFRCQ